MLDGGFVKKEYAAIFHRDPSSLQIEQFSQKLQQYTSPDDTLLRVYYYDTQGSGAGS
jgi:hypothetical protein